ncbi:cysteine hydrolase family protein [Burkholderia sp. Bp9142]|uniref:cysteine hydrolase family protein n=1 Tax=Burkholderia sp. Bp9142 TaxID=2184573 RepID=UPI000F5A21A6|nr:cysteine hydrolase [Burkholderia sp. Bp9142]RQR33248.1 cysteine hydrolase [Burkholderia sp. Bp9142]
MVTRLNLDVSRTALLLMDLQRISFDWYVPKEQASELLENTANLLAAARSAKVKVIYVTVGFRHGYPEISPRNELFCSIRDEALFARSDVRTEIHQSVTPYLDEPIVIKSRIGGFSGTDLQTLLSAASIETLVIAGVTTSGSVLSTIRQAFDMDYRLIIARDCCADLDDEVHRVLMEKVFPHHADVVLSGEIRSAILS